MSKAENRAARAWLAEHAPVSFRDFMEAALYDPSWGYYGSGRVRFGRSGDFTTSSGVSRVFGVCLARWIASEWERLGRPSDFVVVELGPGTGQLAEDILGSKSAACVSRYVCVERSPALRDQQRERLAGLGDRVAFESLEQLAGRPVTGVVLANEVFDALPVHRFRRRGGQLEELFVDVDKAGAAREVWSGALSPRLAREDVSLTSEGEFEIGVDALRMLDDISAALHMGSVLVLDYGYQTFDGTGSVRGMRGHEAVPYLLENIGNIDLTADVNFGALAGHGQSLGFDVDELVPQSRFLQACGIADVIAELVSDPSVPQREVLAAKSLLVPAGYGSAFHVLAMRRRKTGHGQLG